MNIKSFNVNHLNIVLCIFLTILLGFLIHILYNQKTMIEKYQTKAIHYCKKYKDLKQDYSNFIKKNYFLEVTATAYTKSVDETNENPETTAIMENSIPGWTVAVSRDLSYLLGKKVYIEGVGIRKVTDLMNKRYSKRIDVLVPNKQYAREFGKKENVKVVTILE